MPLEALKTVTTAEEAAKKRKSDAAAEAKKRIAEAQQEGEHTLAEAGKKAAAAREAAQKAFSEESERKLAENLALLKEKNAMIRNAALPRMERAAQLIVERIVNG